MSLFSNNVPIILKWLYFWSGFAAASGPLYLPLLYSSVYGLSKDQIGIVTSIVPLVSFVATPAITYIGERWIGLKCAVAACTFLGFIAFDSHLLLGTFVKDLTSPLAMLILILISVGYAMTLSSVGTLLDSITLKLLFDKCNNDENYGKQRLWCSVSWGIGAFFTGSMAAWTGSLVHVLFISFTAASILQLALILIFLPSITNPYEMIVIDPDEEIIIDPNEEIIIDPNEEIIIDPNESHSHVNQNMTLDEPNPINDDLDNLINDESILINDDHLMIRNDINNSPTPFSIVAVFFLISITLIGMVFSLIQTYLFIFISKDLNGTSLISGLCTPIGIIAEIPIFYYSSKILKRFSPLKMILFAHFLLFIRLVAYTFLPPALSFLILPIELFHGLAFALTWTAGLEISSRLSSNSPIFISIFCSVYNNVGGIFGTIIGGYLYEGLGYKWLWMACQGLLLLSVAFLSISHLLHCRVSLK